MIIQPIIPIWIMAIICVLLFLIRIREKGGRWIQLIICLLLFAINLRPLQLSGEVETQECDLDVVLVVDNTLSMHANDYNGKQERIIGVKEAVTEIIEGLPGARFAVISFNNTSQIMAPYTKDTHLVLTAVKTLPQIDVDYARGSSLNTPMKDMERMLTNSRECEEDRKTVVIFISDGEITNNKKLESFSHLKKYTDEGIVIGIGTKEGGTMSYTDDYLGLYTGYIKDPKTRENAVSRIDEENLKQIADDLGIGYVHYTENGDIEKKAAEIREKSETAATAIVDGAKDLYFYFLIPLIGVILFDCLWMERRKGNV